MTRIDLNHCPGRYDCFSPVIGARAEQLKNVQLKIRNSSMLRAFEVALHGEGEHSIDHLYVLPLEKKEEADSIAKKLFSKYIAPYASQGVTSENAVEFVPSEYWSYGSSPGLTIRKKQDKRSGVYELHLHAVVNREGGISRDGKGYLPAFVIAYHELQHVEEGIEEDYMGSRAMNYFLLCRQ